MVAQQEYSTSIRTRLRRVRACSYCIHQAALAETMWPDQARLRATAPARRLSSADNLWPGTAASHDVFPVASPIDYRLPNRLGGRYHSPAAHEDRDPLLKQGLQLDTILDLYALAS